MAAKLLLPGSVSTGPSFTIEDIDAEKLLGVHAVRGPDGYALVMRPTGSTKSRRRRNSQYAPPIEKGNRLHAVVVHQRPKPALGNILTTHVPHGASVVMLFRGIPRDLSPWLDNMAKRAQTFNGAYPNFVDRYRSVMLPNPSRVPIGRDMVFSTDARHIFKADMNKSSARMGGQIVPFANIGALWQSVLDGTPMNLETVVESNTAAAFAASDEVKWRGDTAIVEKAGEEESIAYRYFAGHPDYTRLAQLMALDADILFRFEALEAIAPKTHPDRLMYVEGINGDTKQVLVVWATCYIRISSRVKGDWRNPTYPDFKKKQEALRATRGSWVKASQTSDKLTLEEAYRAFVAGGGYPKWIIRHSVKNPNAVLGYLGKLISKADSAGGDLAFGRDDLDNPVLYSEINNPIIAVIGQTGLGKTAWAETHALQRTKRVLEIKYAFRNGSHAKGMRWFAKFGGKAFAPGEKDTLMHPLPTGFALSPDGRLLDARTEEEEQVLLDWAQEDARLHAIEAVEFMRDGRPLGVYPNAQTVWYTHWTLWFWKYFTDLWENLQLHYHVSCIFDDVTRIVREHSDNRLGEIPAAVGKSMRDELHQSISTVRSLGFSLYLLGHSLAGFKANFPEGMLDECNLLIRLRKDGHIADIANPASDEFKANETFERSVRIDLGDDLPNDFGQPTPKY